MRKAFLIAVSFCLLLCGIACSTVQEKAPCFVDRSSGWTPSVMKTYAIELDRYDAENATSEVIREFLCNKSLSDLKTDAAIQKTEVKEYAKLVLTAYYQGTSVKMDRNGTVKENAQKDAWLYVTKHSCVSVRKDNGAVLVCVDTRVQPEVSIREKGSIRLDVAIDLAALTAEELKTLSEDEETKFKDILFATSIEERLPLTALTAFETTVRHEIDKRTSSYLAEGGEFCVYYSHTSDAFLVVNATSINVVARATGERLLIDTFTNRGDKDCSTVLS